MLMSFADYRISELWASFMPRRKEIKNNLTNDLISLVIYSPDNFLTVKPDNEFERWAAVEVDTFDEVPSEMDTYIIISGLYAIKIK